jgi:(2Fe-2S) ferredoxin
MYYAKHVFICTNQRDNGQECCADGNASELFKYAKSRIKALGINGKGNIRMNNAGCLDRCSAGPVLVIYPEGAWYHYTNQQDIDEIIEQHILNGKPVERLLLKN